MNEFKVAILDDHQLFIDGLRFILKDQPEFNVIGTANKGEEMLSLLKTTEVDIVLLDVQLKGIDGIEVAKKIKEDYPTIRILIVSMCCQISIIKKLLRINVDGYILKERGQQEVNKALTAIQNGERFFSDIITQTLTDSMSGRSTRPGLNHVSLTKREFEVLECVAEGLTTDQIASKLFVASSTIITHRKNIMQKLEVKNVAEMIRLSTEVGLLA